MVDIGTRGKRFVDMNNPVSISNAVTHFLLNKIFSFVWFSWVVHIFGIPITW